MYVRLCMCVCVCPYVHSDSEGPGESPAACPVLTPPINLPIKAGSQGELQRFAEKVSALYLCIFNIILIKQQSLKMHIVWRLLRGVECRREWH